MKAVEIFYFNIFFHENDIHKIWTNLLYEDIDKRWNCFSLYVYPFTDQTLHAFSWTYWETNNKDLFLLFIVWSFDFGALMNSYPFKFCIFFSSSSSSSPHLVAVCDANVDVVHFFNVYIMWPIHYRIAFELYILYRFVLKDSS